MLKKNFALLLGLFVVNCLCLARPALADVRFQAMDADSNSMLSLKEFMDANPNMSEQAFAIIDLDKNDLLSHEEWDNFLNKHSMPDGLKMDVTTTKLPVKDGPDMPTMPNITMPTMPTMPTNTKPTVDVPSVVKGMDSLPLLSAPLMPEPDKMQMPSMPEMPTIQEPTIQEPTIKSPTISIPTIENYDKANNSLPLLSAPKNK